MSQGIGGHTRPNRGASVEWETPPEILAALGPFDDDPCLPGHTNGLSRPWRGFVWLNPPYTRDLGLWLARLAAHPDGGIALVFARTETRIFWDEVWKKATALLFLMGRPHFYQHGERAKGNSGGPVCLVGYGQIATRRLATTRLRGAYISFWEPRDA